MNHHLLALALAASFVIPATAIEPGKSQTLTSPEQVPEGLSAADWQGIQSAASQQAYLKPSNPGASDLFGAAVAVSGDTVVVGAFFEDSSTSGINSSPNEASLNSGAVYIFTRSGGIWSQQAYLKASNPGAGDSFGYSVAIAGETVVVGAYAEDSFSMGVNSTPNEMMPDAGAAYVFTRSSGIWSQQAYLKASNPGGNDHFGNSVAVSGDTVVIGSPAEDSHSVGVNNNQVNNLALDSGASYVFTRGGSSWSQQVYLKASNSGAGDFFGYSVAISGETVVVGAVYEASATTGVNSSPNELGYDSGAAYIFTRSSGGSWSQQAYLKASNTGQSDTFGSSVAISGETVVVGAKFEDSATTGVNSSSNDAAADAGAAYVFTRIGASWSQQAYLKASNPGPGDYFGNSVAISGETVVIGAFAEDSSGIGVNSPPDETMIEAGAAYVFTRSGISWNQQSYFKASNTQSSDVFGASVAISDNTVIVGANLEDSITTGINSIPNDAGTADNSGAAYIFTLPVAVPPVVKYWVKVKLSPGKFGKVTVVGSFTAGSKVTLRAKPKKGHKFSGWYEKKKLLSKKAVLVIKKLTKNRSLVAKFK